MDLCHCETSTWCITSRKRRPNEQQAPAPCRRFRASGNANVPTSHRLSTQLGEWHSTNAIIRSPTSNAVMTAHMRSSNAHSQGGVTVLGRLQPSSRLAAKRRESDGEIAYQSWASSNTHCNVHSCGRAVHTIACINPGSSPWCCGTLSSTAVSEEEDGRGRWQNSYGNIPHYRAILPT
jgi:hypothetical protein